VTVQLLEKDVSLFQGVLVAWCILGTALADKTTALVKRDGKNLFSLDKNY
jgi:hypothetical protein